MQPREIDVLIAEKIMDLKTPTYYDFYEEKELPVRGVFVSNYSTDIAAAMQVAIELGLLISPTLTEGWGAGLFLGTTGHPDGGRRYCVSGTWTEHRELPMAICLAALKCKGVEVG